MISGTCAQCGVAYETYRVTGQTARKFCTDRCRNKYNNDLAVQRLLDDPAPSPERWDGVEKYNDTPDRSDYRVVCTWCSEEEWEFWAKHEIPKRLARCRRCGGFRVVEPDMHTGKVPTRAYATKAPA